MAMTFVNGGVFYTFQKAVFYENTGTYRIFPNPVKDKLYIQGLSPGATVELWDVTGILRMREEETDGELDLSGLPGGIYLLRVREPGALSHRKGGVWKFVRE